MVQKESILTVADNSGALKVRCIQPVGSTGKRFAFPCEEIICSIISVKPRTSKVNKGDVCRALIVRAKHPFLRPDGSYVRFNENAVVLLSRDGKEFPYTRVFGPVLREVRRAQDTKDSPRYKIVSIALEVV